MLPYNHLDPREKQRPLPLVERDLPAPSSDAMLGRRRLVASIPAASGRNLKIALDTDSEHLATFFSANWPTSESSSTFDGLIVARKLSAAAYGLGVDFDQARYFCLASHQVWVTGSEFYGNIKITVRGLCSALAIDDEMYVHGCSMILNGRGVIVAGASGVGKTTITSELRRICMMRVINDDWGPMNLGNREAVFTGEPQLHMKYSSVTSLLPFSRFSPGSNLSENFQGDSSDPKARILIARDAVFGKSGIADSAYINRIIVLTRDLAEPMSARALTEADLPLLASGGYSEFYGRDEPFLNGSLFLTSAGLRERQVNLHKRLLRGGYCMQVNNNGLPSEVAKLVLQVASD